MAITLDAQSVTAVPGNLPRSGGGVAVQFRFRTNSAGQFTTRYTLTNPQYTFGNGTRSVSIGQRTAPGSFADPLGLRASVANPSSPSAVIELQVTSGSEVQSGFAIVIFRDIAVNALVATLGALEVAQRAGLSRSTINRFNRGETVSNRTLRAVDDVILKAVANGEL